MRAAGGETRAGIVVMHAARGAACRPAGMAPVSRRLMPNPARVERLPSPVYRKPGRASHSGPRQHRGDQAGSHPRLYLAERFEQELQLGGVLVVQLRISREGGIAVASENRLELADQRLEDRRRGRP